MRDWFFGLWTFLFPQKGPWDAWIEFCYDRDTHAPRRVAGCTVAYLGLGGLIAAYSGVPWPQCLVIVFVWPIWLLALFAIAILDELLRGSR